jgi:hypothetical protein
MKLIYPQNRLKWDPNKLPGIPDRFGKSTGYILIGAAQSGFDLYVAFADEFRTNVWIEKASTLNPLAKAMCMEMLERIDNDQEFTRAHQFFIKEGLLDGVSKEKT